MAAAYFYRTQEEENPLYSEIQLGDKTVVTPFYGSFVRSNIDAECLRETILSGQLKNTQVVCYTIAEAERFRSMLQKGLFEFSGQKTNFRPVSEFILTIDPAGEYLQYNVSSEVQNILEIQDLPEAVRKILSSDGKERTKNLKVLMTDEKKLSGVVEWYLKKSIRFGSKVAVAPCLPIKGANTLRFALTANRIAVVTQETNEWQKAVYYLIDFAAFKDAGILNTILSQIAVLKPNIVLFKVYQPKFYEGDAIVERMHLGYFLNYLADYRQKNRALTFAINVDALGYHYLAQRLCGFIEPIGGNFNPDMRMRRKAVDLEDNESMNGGPKLGKYPHPLKLIECTHDDLKRLKENTGEPLPCHCPECSKYDRLPTEGRVYNRLRRKHRVFTRDTFISELNEAAKNGTIKASMFDRMAESPKLNLFKSAYS